MIKKFKSMISKALDGLFKNKKSVTTVEDYEQRIVEEDAVSEVKVTPRSIAEFNKATQAETKKELYGEEFLVDYPFTKNEMRVIARDQGCEYRYSGKLRKGFIH